MAPAGTFALPTCPPRFAQEKWSQGSIDRNFHDAWGDSSPLELGRAMPNECRVQCEAPRQRREGVLHIAQPGTVGSVRRDLHGSTQASCSRSTLGFEAPSHWAASWPQAGLRASHGGTSVMVSTVVAPFGVGALRVARKHTEPPCARWAAPTYEANRSRRCDATELARELHLSAFGEAPTVGDGCPGVVPFSKSTATLAVTRGIG